MPSAVQVFAEAAGTQAAEVGYFSLAEAFGRLQVAGIRSKPIAAMEAREIAHMIQRGMNALSLVLRLEEENKAI